MENTEGKMIEKLITIILQLGEYSRETLEEGPAEWRTMRHSQGDGGRPAEGRGGKQNEEEEKRSQRERERESYLRH